MSHIDCQYNSFKICQYHYICIKRYGRSCKNDIFMVASIFSKSGFLIEDKKTSEFLAPNLSARLLNPRPLNPGPSLVVFQTLKYGRNDFQQILKSVPRQQLHFFSSQDQKISKNPQSELLSLGPCTFISSTCIYIVINLSSSRNIILSRLALKAVIGFFLQLDSLRSEL